MKLNYIYLFVLSVFCVSCKTKDTRLIGIDPVINQKSTSESYDSSTLLINYEGKEVLDSLKSEIQKYGASVAYDYNNFNIIAITIPENKNIDEALKYFEKVKGVLSVERNAINQLQNIN